jgi:hypothetical protein
LRLSAALKTQPLSGSRRAGKSDEIRVGITPIHPHPEELPMKKTLLTALITACSLFAGTAFAADAACEAKALDKNGKPLAGAAKTSFMKKCEGDAGGAACEAKAVDKNGKALAGAAKTSFMKKCSADAAPAAAKK